MGRRPRYSVSLFFHKGVFLQMEKSEVLFSIFGLDVTSQVTTTWVIMLVLIIIALIIRCGLKEKPGRFQNMIEMAMEALDNFFVSLLGEDKGRRYFPLFGTLFVFILLSNLIGIIPGAGTLKGFAAPTSCLSVTAALAIVVFFSTHILGFKVNGLRYFKHFVSPMAFMLPFLLIDEIVHPVSLSLRLFGNVYGDESITHQLYGIIPVGVPMLMMVLSLLFCLIQSMVFSMLAAIYVDTSTGEGH